MKKFLCSLCVCILACISVVALKAQCPFTGTVQTTESRCKQSGTITINMVPAAAYAYQITAGPRTTSVTSSNVFSGLPTGTYTVTVTLGGCSINLPATVTGNYLEPSLLKASVKNIACPTGTGTLTASEPTNGRKPYKYAIISGPVTRPSQASTVFDGLPKGTYTLQAFDSCGVVRTSNFSIAYDTGKLHSYTYDYDLRYSGCNDLVICPIAGFLETKSHSLMMVWYIKPNGDTLKVNNFEAPVRCDTLVGEGHSYGNWKMIGFDTCGRKSESTFTFNAPTMLNVNLVKYNCTGPFYNISNLWKYGLAVGYRIRKCSDNSIVYEYIQVPQTTFHSPEILLDFNTCYYFEHWNNCGDTVREMRTTVAKPVFKIYGYEGTACSVNGKGSIRVAEYYQTGVKPITFTIIAGPEGIGMTAVQRQHESYVYLRDLALGTYTVAAIDDCGNKDTLSITLTKPLNRLVEITQTPDCGAGSNIHVKITSNFNTDRFAQNDIRNITYVTATSPGAASGVNPVNIIKTAPTATTPSVWEADYFNVPNGNFYLQTFSDADGCNWDTTINITGYVQPALNSTVAYFCEATGMGIIDYNLIGGKNPYQYRLRTQGTSNWGSWQSNTNFTGITAGTYDINVVDICPNGSITSVSFQPWVKSGISISAPCVGIGQSLTLTANPNIDGINYQWYFNGALIGTGAQITIPNYQPSNNGVYTLLQNFPGGSCQDSAKRTVFDCLTMPVKVGSLNGEYYGNEIKLTWKTFQEEPGMSFEIEKSSDGIMFKKLATMSAGSNPYGKMYNYLDNTVEDVNYYRIKYRSADGKIGFTNKVRLAKETFSDVRMSISPNPSYADITVHFNALKSSSYVLQVTDVTGKVLYKTVKNTIQGPNTILIGEDQLKLLPGIYIVELRGGGQIFNQKISRF